MVMKTTLAQDCKKFNSTKSCRLQVNHPQLLKQNIYFVFMFWSLEVEYLCKCNMYFCKNTSLLTGGCSTYITLAGARTGIVRCPDGHRPKRFLKVSGACQTSYDARPGIGVCIGRQYRHFYNYCWCPKHVDKLNMITLTSITLLCISTTNMFLKVHNIHNVHNISIN